MNIAKQLYQLQEIDLELEANQQALDRVVSQLGESAEVVQARNRLASEQQLLEELKREQHSLEWEIDDLSNRISTLEQKLYSGKVANPKELANLQRDVEGLKARRSQLEDKALEIMDQSEATEASVATLNNELNKLEAEWQSQQQQLSTEMEQLKTTLSQLEEKRQTHLAGIDPKLVDIYQQIKKQKGQALAGVEQGACHGCGISLATAELQRARTNNLVQCSNCGRILFLPLGGY